MPGADGRPMPGRQREGPRRLVDRLIVVNLMALLPACGLALHLLYEQVAGTFHSRAGMLVEAAIGMLCVAVGVVATRVFAARFLLDPISAVLRATRRMAAGDLAVRISQERAYAPGELGDLAAGIDQMAARLEARERQLAVEIQDRHSAQDLAELKAAAASGLARVASRLNAQLDLHAVLAAVCAEAAKTLSLPVSLVRLHDETHEELRLTAVHGLPRIYLEHSQAIPRSYCDRLLGRGGRAAIIPDFAQSDLPDAALYQQYGLRSGCIVTLVREGRLIGTLAVASVGGKRQFEVDDEATLTALADEAAAAVANAQNFAAVQRSLEQTRALREIDRAIVGSVDLGVVLRLVAEEAIRHLGVDAADVLLFNAQTRLLRFANGVGFRRPAPQASLLSLSGGHAGRVAQERRTVAISQLREDGDTPPWAMAEGFASYHGVPLLVKGEVKGVLELFLRRPRPLDDEQCRFCDSLAAQAAVAIHNAALFEDLQRSTVRLSLAYDATIAGWSRALDLRDKETEGHTQRVTEMTLCLAESMGLSDDDLVHLRRGALLHDIGKMGVPDYILLKPGALDAQEKAIMQRHPELAFEMLSPIEFLRPALDIPWCHHERWDGSGYPRGLRGEQIPLAARIFAVVDVWDALRSERPYRAAWAEADVRRHLQSGAGRTFDPRVVEAFLALGPKSLSSHLPDRGSAAGWDAGEGDEAAVPA